MHRSVLPVVTCQCLFYHFTRYVSNRFSLEKVRLRVFGVIKRVLLVSKCYKTCFVLLKAMKKWLGIVSMVDEHIMKWIKLSPICLSLYNLFSLSPCLLLPLSSSLYGRVGEWDSVVPLLLGTRFRVLKR